MKIRFGFYRELLRYDTPKAIRQIRIPTIIIHGAKDELVTMSHSMFAYRLLRQPKKLLIISGMPHT